MLSKASMRYILNLIDPYMGFIMFYVLFPGGVVFSTAQLLYYHTFDWSMRQRIKESPSEPNHRGGDAEWEDPMVVGRNRRTMYSDVAHFQSRLSLFQYCRDYLFSTRTCNRITDKDPRKEFSPSTILLTGEPGLPDDTNHWMFLLVSDPSSAPLGWEQIDYQPDGHLQDGTSYQYRWTEVQLPQHWQLQGFDIPIYTNTSYPFQFDPPRARRTGLWTVVPCDLGLGGSTETSKPLHPKEPGENATGLYRCVFSLPSEWMDDLRRGVSKTHRLFLTLAGVDACASVWVNGAYIGYSQDSCLPVEFDITSACCIEDRAQHDTKTVTLAVKVCRWCDGSYLEDQDKWWLSGIYREVTVTRRPVSFICDFEFASILHHCPTAASSSPSSSTGAAADVAKISVAVLAEGVAAAKAPSASTNTAAATHAVRVELWDDMQHDSAPVLTLLSELSSGRCFPLRSAADQHYRISTAGSDAGEADRDLCATVDPGLCSVEGLLPNPKLWTAETPHLYTLIISLYRSLGDATIDSNDLHSIMHRVGVRQVSIGGPDNVLRVNEVPITVAGINRHEFSPDTGRAVSKESMMKDALLLKRLNFNAVRSSHYPQHPHWLEVCDEVGLYVIDEANIETHGFQSLGQPVNYLLRLPEWRSSFMSRVTRMFERDKNHACIIGWSLGNECGHGETSDLMAGWLRTRDPTRFVQYESGGARTAATDIICPMYVRPRWCEEQAVGDVKRRPVILCEYAHAMGNSGGCLTQYWKRFRDKNLPRIQGGFIWDFCDQGLMLPDKSGYGYGGDFGDFPNTKQFCCNGILSPCRQPFPSAFEAAHLQSPVEISLFYLGGSGGAVRGGPKPGELLSSEGGMLTGDDQHMLVVSNRRSFRNLSDVTVVVTLRYHRTGIKPLVVFDSLRIDCSSIAAGAYQIVPLDHYLEQAISKGPIAVADDGGGIERLDLEVDDSGEAWLDVIAVKSSLDPLLDRAVLACDALTSEECYEVLHSSLMIPSLLERLEASVRREKEVQGGATRGVVSMSEMMMHLAVEDDDSDSSSNSNNNNTGCICIRWMDGSHAMVGKSCGRLISWVDRNGSPLLASPLDGCLYRAGTDNDRGGMGVSYYSRWKECGLDSLVRRDSRETAVVSCQLLDDGAVEVISQWTWESPHADLPVTIPCSARYLFRTEGSIDVAFRVHISECSMIPPLPRCGLRWSLPQGFDRVSWFGRGPIEAYDDRKSAAYFGVFESLVEDLHTHYTFPQENGRRADPRWVVFKQSSSEVVHLVVVPLPSKRGAAVVADEGYSVSTNDNSSQGLTGFLSGWGFSASRYSQETLDSTAHDHELFPDEDHRVHVHVDSYTMGVGGYDSWSPNVDDQYQLVLNKNSKEGLLNPHPSVTSIRWSGRDVHVIQTSIRIAPVYSMCECIAVRSSSPN